MKKLWLVLLLAVPLWAVTADEEAPKGFNYWNAQSFAELNKTMAPKAAADAHHVALQKLSDDANDYIIEVHRVGDGAPELHETEVDIYFVQSGSGMLVVGGTLTGADTTAPHEMRNGTIQGGIRRPLAPGDVVRVPPKTPHQVVLNGSKEITYIVVKVKGY
jgi:mannose-6-phosphate isomerase-like protein (cupin superfamily)